MVILVIALLCPEISKAATDPDAVYRGVPDAQSYVPAELVKRVANPRDLKLRSHIGLVYDERDDIVLYKKGEKKKTYRVTDQVNDGHGDN